MITAIIPCYNAEPYLGQAIESVLAQTRPVEQIIVVDDCSTDGSVALARTYPRVEVLSTPRNSGHATARNVAIEATRGDLIAWLDADDYWNADHCEVVCGLLDRFPEAGVAYSAVRRFGGSSPETVWHDAPVEEEPFDAYWLCFNRTIVPAMSAVTRTATVRQAGGFDASIRIAPDFEFWMRMARLAPFVGTPLVTSNYRTHDKQITTQWPYRQYESMYRSRQRHRQAVEANGETELAAELGRRIELLWHGDLNVLWHHRRLDVLPVFLDFQPHIGRETEFSRRMRKNLRTARVTEAMHRQPALGLVARQLTRIGRKAKRVVKKGLGRPQVVATAPEPFDSTLASVINPSALPSKSHE